MRTSNPAVSRRAPAVDVDALRKAVDLYRRGDIDGAAKLCRRVVRAAPDNFTALHLLGIIAFRKRRFDEAKQLIGRALAASPGDPAALNSLGNVLTALGQHDEAIACYERALAARPDFAEAHFARANLILQQGRHAEALAGYDRALAIRQDFAAAHNGRGTALRQMGRTEDALSCYDRALAFEPRFADALYNRGNALHDLGRPEEALASFDRALAVQPDFAFAHNNRGTVLRELGRPAEALDAFDRALAIQPDFASAHNNRGNALRDLHRFDEALDAFDRALEADPQLAGAHYSAAQCRLLIGDLQRGWAEYAWRDRLDRPLVSQAQRFHRAMLPADLAGRHVVVEREQGLGDELLFLRFAPELRRREATVTYLSDPRLSAMLARTGIVDRVLPQQADAGACDLRLTVGDLPWLLGMGDADTPAPFVIPPLPEREAELRALLEGFGPAPRIGITWRAGTVNSGRREVPLEMLGAALRGVAATPVALQRLPGPGEIRSLEALLGRPVLDLTARNEDLEDMLALMGLLEFYVGVSNTNQHLRVARGRTSHVLAVHSPDFSWRAEGAESPWFPGTRVYRQSPDGGWSDALAALARDLPAA